MSKEIKPIDWYRYLCVHALRIHTFEYHEFWCEDEMNTDGKASLYSHFSRNVNIHLYGIYLQFQLCVCSRITFSISISIFVSFFFFLCSQYFSAIYFSILHTRVPVTDGTNR